MTATVNAPVNGASSSEGENVPAIEKAWRRVPESNRSTRICNPLRNLSANSPGSRGTPVGYMTRRPRASAADGPAGAGPIAPGPALCHQVPKPRHRSVLPLPDFATRRTMMVDTQVRPSDVTRFPIIEAMLHVPREAFVPESRQEAPR